jgi:Tfp pilus assembly protein PilF
MGLFGFFRKQSKEIFQLPEQDRIWVEENFAWLIQAFGYSDIQKAQITLTENFFPATFRAEKVEVGNIIHDLCDLFQIGEQKITYEIHEDLRDVGGMPFMMVGKPFETELEQSEENYQLHIAKNLFKHPKRLIFSLTYEFTRIKLLESKLVFDESEDTEMFIYLAGVYFGFGVILTQNLRETGTSNDGAWETTWQFTSPMPDETMIFALALYSKIMEQESPVWKEDLRSDLKKMFEQAVEMLDQAPGTNFDKKELLAKRLFGIAYKQYEEKRIEEALESLEKARILAKNDRLKSDIHNNIGYYLLRLGEYEKSIPHLRTAVQLDPNYGYANDNLGYALIQTGALEEGKQWLEKALRTENNNDAYSLRNLALYHQAKGEFNLAETYFLKAFQEKEGAVDLLELHFAAFLLNQGRKEEALSYLEQAVAKGEPEAIKQMKKMH